MAANSEEDFINGNHRLAKLMYKYYYPSYDALLAKTEAVLYTALDSQDCRFIVAESTTPGLYENSGPEDPPEYTIFGWLSLSVVRHGTTTRSAFAASDSIVHTCWKVLRSENHQVSASDPRLRLLSDLKSRAVDGQARCPTNEYRTYFQNSYFLF